jgi:steroid delta-isomerase-like uncharacterized protein
MLTRRAALGAIPGTLFAALAQAAATGNADLIRRYFAVWNSGDLDELDRILAPEYINHTPSTPHVPPGPDGLKPIIASFRAAFPDLYFEIVEVIATDEHAVARVVMTGTHRGSLFGIAATGKRVKVDQINIERIQAGRIVEHWRVTDELSLLRQLGVIPEPSQG